jgi:hypothetical protein
MPMLKKAREEAAKLGTSRMVADRPLENAV